MIDLVACMHAELAQLRPCRHLGQGIGDPGIEACLDNAHTQLLATEAVVACVDSSLVCAKHVCVP
jgi:hypothetical protein